MAAHPERGGVAGNLFQGIGQQVILEGRHRRAAFLRSELDNGHGWSRRRMRRRLGKDGSKQGRRHTGSQKKTKHEKHLLFWRQRFHIIRLQQRVDRLGLGRRFTVYRGRHGIEPPVRDLLLHAIVRHI